MKYLPEINKIPDFSRQRAQFIVRQVKRAQVDQLSNVGRDARQHVVLEVESGQMRQPEQVRTEIAYRACYLHLRPEGLLARREVLRRHERLRAPRRTVVLIFTDLF